MRRILLYFALKYEGDYFLILEAIKGKERVDEKDLKDIEKKINCKYVTIIDENYPSKLKNSFRPPWVLFYYGDYSLVEKNSIAVIGARQNSYYGKIMCEKIVKESKPYVDVIVSGLAYGIDSIAHRQALNSQIKTIAILGSGIDHCYPKEHLKLYEEICKKGLVISEYPNKVTPRKDNFLIRNRLIAGLSEQVVVIEANYKSGTMNTVTFALEYGKDVCCVPSLATKKSGCNMLIKQGAKLVENAKDIFENNF